MKKMQTVHWLQSMTDLVWKTNKKNVVANVPDGAFAEEKRIGSISILTASATWSKNAEGAPQDTPSAER